MPPPTLNSEEPVFFCFVEPSRQLWRRWYVSRLILMTATFG